MFLFLYMSVTLLAGATHTVEHESLSAHTNSVLSGNFIEKTEDNFLINLCHVREGKHIDMKSAGRISYLSSSEVVP